jgi:hypothetical protein
VDEVGAACAGCKRRKYGCSHTGNADLKTMWVSRAATTPESGLDVEFVEDRKGKKRKAESPVPVTKKKKVTVKLEKTKKGKEKVERRVERPKASGLKPTARRHAAPKSSAVVVDISDDDDDAMEVDEESEEAAPNPKRRPKRTQVAHGTFLLHSFFFLYINIFFRCRTGAQQATCCA